MDYASIFLNYAPLVLLLGFWFFVNRKFYGDQKRHIDEVMDINRKLIEQNERMIEQLEQIKLLLQDRKN